MNAMIAGVIRAALAAVGGWLVSNGVIAETEVDGIIGAGVIIATAIWSMISKRQEAKKLAASVK
jgi:hypothetical protein